MSEQPPTEPGDKLDAWLAARFGWRWEPPYSIRIPGPNPDWPSCGAWVAPDGTWRISLGWSTDPGLAVTEVVAAMNKKEFSVRMYGGIGGGFKVSFTGLIGDTITSLYACHSTFAGAMALAAAAVMAAEDTQVAKGESDGPKN